MVCFNYKTKKHLMLNLAKKYAKHNKRKVAFFKVKGNKEDLFDFVDFDSVNNDVTIIKIIDFS